METIEKLRKPAVVERKRMPAGVEVRGAAVVYDAKTGKPKFDLPMCMYPSWAQEAFRVDMRKNGMSEAEIAEFFG